MFVLVLGAMFCFRVATVGAAEQECVGTLALAVMDDVAIQLKLTGEQKEKLLDLIDQRESEAVGPAMEYRDLSPKERAEKMAAFRKESEAQGMTILTPEQQAKLEQVRIRRLGLASLAEPAVVTKFDLTDEQKKQVAEVLEQREKDLAKADDKTTRVIQATTERKLASILNEKQKSAWEALAGGETLLAQAPKGADAAPSDNRQSGSAPVTATAEKPTAQPNVESEKKSPAADVSGGEKPAEVSGLEKAAAEAVGKKDDVKPAPPTMPPAEAKRDERPTTSPAAAPTAEANAAEPKKHAEKLRFNFRYQPWKDVLDWFAQQADMSLVMDAPPPGTFNYTDDREYSPAQAIDLLNGVLLTKGYVLIRRERMLIVVNKADGIPPGLVQTITPDQLEGRGEFELVCVLFNLDKLAPEEAESEVRKLLGPEGSVVALSKSRQIMVTETGGRLKAIRSLIQRVEDPQNVLTGQIRTIELQQAPPETVLPIVKQMLDIPDDKTATADGTLRLAVDPSGRRIIATGKPEKITRLEEIIKVIDVVKPGGPQVGIQTTPQLLVYPITTADPQSVLSVLQTLLQGQPDVRLALDGKTNSLIALARPADHATIRATIDDMQHDSRKMEVIRLQLVDPQLALAAIVKLFGITTDPKTTPANAPQVQADATTRQIFVQGTDGQIAQIRQLLEKMGETEVAAADLTNEKTVRMLNVPQRSARSILEQIQGVWPNGHKNKIREVAPSAVIPSMTPVEGDTPSDIPQHLIDRLREEAPKDEGPPHEPNRETPRTIAPPAGSPPAAADSRDEEPQETRAAPESEQFVRRALSSDRAMIRFVAEEVPALPPAAEPAQPLAVPSGKSAKSADRTVKIENPNDGAPIIVSIGPNGVMIASEDTKALDEFEKLFTSLASTAANNNSNLTIFYLKHAKAATVAETLDQIFGGGTLQQSDSGGGGGLLGDLAGAAMGDAGGGVVGTLLSGMGSGSIKPSGTLKITPDPRLNALVVQANPTDVDTIEQLLKILDQKGSPEEILFFPKPRQIPLTYTDAEKMVEIVKSTFQNRLEAAAGAPGGNQPNPMQILQMLRGGGRRGGGGGGGNQAEDIEKMTVTADTRTNSLIVAASDALFQDVKELVDKLDVPSEEGAEAMRVIPLHHASPDVIESTLQAVAGDNVQFNRATGSSANRGGSPMQAMPQFGGGRRGQFGGGGANFGGGGQNFGGRNFGGGGQNFGGRNFGGGQGGGGNFGGGQGGGNRGGGNRGGGGGGRGGGQ
jgi:type II secretory pathway component GspD/PulD (secretin)